MYNKEGFLKKLFNSSLDLLFPEEGICFICDKFNEEVKDDHICNDCRDKLFFIDENKCPTCGKPTNEQNLEGRCHYCANKTFHFNKAFSSLIYIGILKKTIYRYKYEAKPYIFKALGEVMLRTLMNENIEDIDMIVPVPLHRRRKAERGYNQSELLGKYLSLKLNIPINSKNLIRTKSTKIQNKLDRQQRQQNVKGAFKVKGIGVFKDKRILLVDDIFTTGATVNECSRALIESGAAEILVMTVATGQHL